jgi:hypothetical protein
MLDLLCACNSGKCSRNFPMIEYAGLSGDLGHPIIPNRPLVKVEAMSVTFSKVSYSR